MTASARPATSPLGITTSTITSVTEIGEAGWAGLTGAAVLYQTYQWQVWAEKYYPLDPLYVVARDEAGALVGALSTNIMREAPDRLITWYDPVRMFLAPHTSTDGANEAWFPVLLLGGCSGYHSEVLYAPHLDEAGRIAVRAALLAEAGRVAEAAGCRSTTLMYATEDVARDTVAGLDEVGLGGSGARLIPSSAKAIIDLGPEPTDVAGFMSRFPSRQRKKHRKEMAAFHRSGIEVTEHPMTEVLNEIAPLAAGHQSKYGDPTTPEQALDYWGSQAHTLGENSVVFASRRDGVMHGFVVFYLHGDTMYGRGAGFDDEAGPYAYFNLSVYEPVRYAVEHGIRRLDLGAGSYEGKLQRGAVNEALWSAVVPPAGSTAEWDEAMTRPTQMAVFAGVAEAAAEATDDEAA